MYTFSGFYAACSPKRANISFTPNASLKSPPPFTLLQLQKIENLEYKIYENHLCVPVITFVYKTLFNKPAAVSRNPIKYNERSEPLFVISTQHQMSPYSWLSSLFDGYMDCSYRNNGVIRNLGTVQGVHLSVLCGSQNKQQLFPYTTLTDWFV